jgi:hypothetical protein
MHFNKLLAISFYSLQVWAGASTPRVVVPEIPTFPADIKNPGTIVPQSIAKPIIHETYTKAEEDRLLDIERLSWITMFRD